MTVWANKTLLGYGLLLVLCPDIAKILCAKIVLNLCAPCALCISCVQFLTHWVSLESPASLYQPVSPRIPPLELLPISITIKCQPNILTIGVDVCPASFHFTPWSSPLPWNPPVSAPCMLKKKHKKDTLIITLDYRQYL